MGDLIPLKDAEFRSASDFIYSRFGIRLGEQKRTLLAGRLSKRVRELGLGSFAEYFSLVNRDGSGGELTELLNLITTNHTFFFRERDHFDFLSGVALPELCADPGLREIRIWSAGCATGEEAYSAAMTAADFLDRRGGGRAAAVLATDISLAALGGAREGVYGEARLRELPRPYLSAYFERRGPDEYAVAKRIRDMVLFKRLNLMAERFPFKGSFDVVFCRNVMIYFDEASRTRLVRSLYEVTRPGGYLFVGHSESLPKADCPFDYLRPAIYRKAA